MPFDPLSAGVAGAGVIWDILKSQQARNDAQKQQAYQQALLESTLAEARSGRAAALAEGQQGQTAAQQRRAEALRTAGGMRLDQFGNATYYDPAQGRWITSYSPAQQALIEGGVARQGRAQARGAQAAEDYDRLRASYLYRQPKTEAQSYAEIVQLLNQAMGTGQQQENALADRFRVRSIGNVPQIGYADKGPTAGQQLAETMLKARGSALDEALKRQAGHASQYLPALKQFEETANYVAPIDPTGAGIVGMQQQGLADYLKTGAEYDKNLTEYDKLIQAALASGNQNVLNAALGGGRNVAQASYTAAQANKSNVGQDFLKLAQMLMPGKTAGVAGTTGGTTGATFTSGGGEDTGPSIGSWDRRFSFGPTTRGVGSEAAPFGGASIGDYDFASLNADPFAVGTAGVPQYSDYFSTRPSDTFAMTGYQTPWRF